MKNFLSKFKSKRGMTYVELIVVLSIFAIMSTVVLFNYNEFQERVEIKRLANQIALKFVEAQKSAMAGKTPTGFSFDINDKPSYGLYFNINNLGDKEFIYFTDLDAYEDPNTSQIVQDGYSSSAEIIQTIQITKGNYIKEIIAYDTNNLKKTIISGYSFLFTRPFSYMKCYDSSGAWVTDFSLLEIIISSPIDDFKATIKINSSGRVQIN